MSAPGVTYWMPNWRNPITCTAGAEEQDGLQRSLVPSTMGTVTIESLRLMLLTFCRKVFGFDCPPLMKTGEPIEPVAAKQSEFASTGQVTAVGKGGGGGGGRGIGRGG